MEYSVLKLVHLFAVVLFMGNIITAVFWMRIAMKTRDLKIITHTMKGVIRSDKVFTIPGILIIVAGGLMAAIEGGYSLISTGWIFWSLVLFTLSGIIYSVKLAPLQKKIAQMTSDAVNTEDFNWIHLFKLYYQWEVFGMIATLAPLGAFVMMVLKIPH